tara:strand:- start:1635 stop:2690 length:1056 start_codon:yes stop_codon:yes gene_type:complete
MNLKNNLNLPLDKFINFSLYDKNSGYYSKKTTFGKNGDFITAPNISRLFSEMIAIWVLSFWKSLGCPKKFNLIELGAGNGEMIKVIGESFQNFPQLLKACKLIIHERSPSLIKVQKKNLKNFNVSWISKINKINKNPSIFIANEFFDSIAIKQFQKRNKIWFEKYVKISKNKKKNFFSEKKFNMQKFEKKINFKISKDQNFIEYSIMGVDYLKKISKIIKKNSGGMILIDYGYHEKKMRNTLQGIYNHKFSNVLDNIGHSDITHNINFHLFEKIVKQTSGLTCNLTSQGSFLTKMGIKERAEIISNNQKFLKKTDIYFRLKRLIDDKEMGSLFKVMFIKNKRNKFNLGFLN